MAKTNDSNLAVLDSNSFKIRKRKSGNSYQAIMNGLGDELLMFGDRPARTAFDYSVKRFIEDWDSYFKKDNPNGVFAYTSPKKKEVRIAAELFNPKLSRSGEKLKFDMRFSKDQKNTNKQINDSKDILTGVLSKGKEASLFLDNFCSILPVCFRTKPDSGLSIVNDTGGRLKVLFDTDKDKVSYQYPKILSDGEATPVMTGRSLTKDYDLSARVYDITGGGETLVASFAASNPDVGDTTLTQDGNSDQVWIAQYNHQYKFYKNPEWYPVQGSTTYPYYVDFGMHDNLNKNKDQFAVWSVMFTEKVIDPSGI